MTSHGEAPRPLATTEQVSEYLGVPVATLYQWKLRDKGPRAAKVGKYLRYRWEDVEAYVAALVGS